MCYLSLVTSSDPVGGVLPLLERLASRDMTVAFCVWLLENYFRRVLVAGSFFISRCCNFFSAKDGCGQGKFGVLLLCNFSRLRLFCAESGLTVLLCVSKDILPVLDNVGVEENYLFVVCWCYFVLIMNCNHRLGCGVHELLVLFCGVEPSGRF